MGSIGVGLAALGLYGLMAFLVTQRTREIAIRMALGASEGKMRSMVMKQAAWLGVAGVAIGLLFAVVLAAACWAPARRAAATDPAVALRSE